MRRRRWLSVAFVGVTAFVACKYSPGTSGDDIVDPDAVVDTPPPVECTMVSAECLNANTLRTCPTDSGSSIDTTCSWGCVATGTAHCGVIAPAGGGATPGDTAPDGFADLAEFELVGNVDGDSGEIAGEPTPDGVAFEIKNGVGIFKFKSLTIPAMSGGVRLIGSRPIVFIADKSIMIADLVNGLGCGGGSGEQPGPGGFVGATTKAMAGSGPGGGGGATINDDDGGGGAGHGALGGAGAGGNAGAGGTTYGTDEIAILQGGAGGGAGDGGGNFGRGGGGGAAVQFISNTDITVMTTGSINAGGCGGSPGTGGSDGGGGGGAGGTILFEAPNVTISGFVAVNGGGGGGGGGGTAGKGSNGLASRNAAAGGVAGSSTRTGGVGGVGGVPAGQPAPTVADVGGGGGGAIGRIRINTRAGSATVDPLKMSPSFEDAASTATQGSAQVQ